MSLPGSGTIKLSEVKAEFGKGNNLLDYLGEGGVTGSAPLKLTDFYGTSAVPPITDTEWNNWIQGQATRSSQADEVLMGFNTPEYGAFCNVYPINQTVPGDTDHSSELYGTPYYYGQPDPPYMGVGRYNRGWCGDPYNGGGWVGSKFSRIIQHAVENQQEWNDLVGGSTRVGVEYSYDGPARGREMTRIDRNGYWGPNMYTNDEIYCNRIEMVYWRNKDGTMWKRQYAEPRVQITSLTREAEDIKARREKALKELAERKTPLELPPWQQQGEKE